MSFDDVCGQVINSSYSLKKINKQEYPEAEDDEEEERRPQRRGVEKLITWSVAEQ